MDEKEKQEKINKSFEVLSICRADLISQGYDEAEVLKLDDGDMQNIADDIGEGNMDGYWISLDVILEENYKLEKKEVV